MRGKLKTLTVFLAIAFLSGLGFWQLERLKWKENLIAQSQARLAAPPLALEKAPKEEFTRVILTGKFLHNHESFFYIALPQGQGYFLFTPFETAQGLVLVNRGFLPLAKKEKATRPQTLVAGAQTITGFLRFSEPPTRFAAEDNSKQNIFYTRDAAKILQNHGLMGADYMVEQEATAAPLPQGGLSRVTFPNKHLDYALTWFVLALTLLVFYGVFVYRQRKEEEK
jgi:surfeit locus 1 family protein